MRRLTLRLYLPTWTTVSVLHKVTLTDVVVVEDALALLEVQSLGSWHLTALEVGLALLGCADTVVAPGDGSEAAVVVQGSVPLDGVVLDLELLCLLLGRGVGLDVVTVP